MEKENDIPINIIKDNEYDKKIKIKFIYNQNEEIYESYKNERIKDLLINFINEVNIE